MKVRWFSISRLVENDGADDAASWQTTLVFNGLKQQKYNLAMALGNNSSRMSHKQSNVLITYIFTNNTNGLTRRWRSDL